MAGIRAKISKPWRRALYSALTISWCSGIVFFVLNRWVRVEGEFGPERHPLQFPFLQLHGAAAFVMMMFLGALFVGHVSNTWALKKQHPMGLVVAIVAALMVISAWLLYYLANQDIRPWVANIHAAMGLLLPLILAIHIYRARRKKSSMPFKPGKRQRR